MTGTDRRFNRANLNVEEPVELEGRGGREQRISGGIVRIAGGLPQRRAAGGRDAGWRGRLTEVDEDVAHGRAGGDEGDDVHRGATVGTQQRLRIGPYGPSRSTPGRNGNRRRSDVGYRPLG